MKVRFVQQNRHNLCCTQSVGAARLRDAAPQRDGAWGQ
jgi:hypothetical protein